MLRERVNWSNVTPQPTTRPAWELSLVAACKIQNSPFASETVTKQWSTNSTYTGIFSNITCTQLVLISGVSYRTFYWVCFPLDNSLPPPLFWSGHLNIHGYHFKRHNKLGNFHFRFSAIGAFNSAHDTLVEFPWCICSCYCTLAKWVFLNVLLDVISHR